MLLAVFDNHTEVQLDEVQLEENLKVATSKFSSILPFFFSAIGGKLNSLRLPVVAVAIACGAGLIGCATLVDSRAEEIIRSELPKLIGPAREYRVDASGVIPANGELKAVRVVGERIARPGSPVIDSAEVNLRELRIDRDARRIESLGGADARARVLADDIANFLNARQGLAAVEVQFHGSDEISISAQPSLASLALPSGARVRVRGYLVPDGARLKLEIADLRVVGFSVGTLPKAALELLINPIVDLSRLPVPARITSVRVENNALMIEANGVTALETGR
jgi:LmeA-like phospholipid-binding